VVLDYSAVVVLIVLSIYACARRNSLSKEAKSPFDLLHFVLGVGLSLSVLMAYQWLCFGSPFLPAQQYMPPVNFTDQGFRGLDWPQLDLLYETAFGIRYGLFTSAPLLLLALYIPGWFRGSIRITGGRETWCIALLCMGYFLFCSANQYGRMQFNTGVRHIVPIIPFLFFIVAGVLLRMPTILATIIGAVTTYWSWCLAMYRDVEQGMGVFNSLIHISLEGFRFPWLKTLENMGYLDSNNFILPLILFTAAVLWALWNLGSGKSQTPAQYRQYGDNSPNENIKPPKWRKNRTS
jgi:hypothetical protein